MAEERKDTVLWRFECENEVAGDKYIFVNKRIVWAECFWRTEFINNAVESSIKFRMMPSNSKFFYTTDQWTRATLIVIISVRKLCPNTTLGVSLDKSEKKSHIFQPSPALVLFVNEIAHWNLSICFQKYLKNKIEYTNENCPEGWVWEFRLGSNPSSPMVSDGLEASVGLAKGLSPMTLQETEPGGSPAVARAS